MKSLPAIEWYSALIQKYNYSWPRYTSYPTTLEFSEDYDDAAFAAAGRYPYMFTSRSVTSCATSAAAIS